MDSNKFSTLREKWRLYFDEGQRDVFDTSTSEESNVKRSTLKDNKVYVELFRVTPTTDSNDFNNTCSDSALSDEIEETTAMTSGVAGLPAAENKLEQHSDFPKLQQYDMGSDGTTVTVDISQLQEHHDEESFGVFSQRDEYNTAHNLEPVLDFDSSGTTPQLRDQPWIQPRVNIAQGICVADLLRPEFAKQQGQGEVQSQECMSDQLFEIPMRMPMQPDLLKSNRNVYTLEDSAGPSPSGVDNNCRGKFARKVEPMFKETQIGVSDETNLQWDMLQMQNNCEAPRIKFRDTFPQWKTYLLQPYMHRHAQYKMNLQPILEESNTIQELVPSELEQLHNARQKLDLELDEEEPLMVQETESDDSDNDYEDAVSESELSSTSSTMVARPNYYDSLFFNILICIAIYLRTMEEGVLAELLNYASFEDIIVFMFMFLSLLLFCTMCDAMLKDENEAVDNDTTDDDSPVEDVEVQPIRRDQIADPQPDRNIEPVMDAPDASQPVPPEQDMERE